MRRVWMLVVIAILAACGSEPGESVEVVVPSGATFSSVIDSLQARGVIDAPGRFKAYARLRGADRQVRSGRYAIRTGEKWSVVLDVLTEGRVATTAVTLPEGYRLKQMAGPLAAVSSADSSTVLAALEDSTAPDRYSLPGPTLEGYLFPDTYRFAEGVDPTDIVGAMVERYRAFWTPERRQRLDSLGLTENELVTLASIIQAEARVVEEMPRISSVYHNRIERGMLLQADPTVLYALGGYRARLLFAAIDSVADSPYNTYTQAGLPPGPIGAPGELALEAALHPAEEDFLYFVARPDGSHIFTRSLQEHNQAIGVARRERLEANNRP